MIRDIFMPALSSTMTEGKIVEWTKSPGDKVAKGETVVVVESDKADMDVESFYDGFLAAVIVDAGNEAPVGSAIALLAETEAEIEQAQAQAAGGGSKPADEPAPAAAPPAPVAAEPVVAAATPAAPARNGRVVVSPRARKLAKELKVDLSGLQGSGPHGRIVAADVEVAAGKTPTPTPSAQFVPAPVAAPAAAAPAPAPAPIAGETVPFNTFQQAVIRNMNASSAVPVFRVAYTIDTTALDALYKQIKPKGVTMTALLAKAVAMTLRKHPIVNARFSDAGINYPSSINVAVAVAMPDGGLITPVLQQADQIDIYSLSRTWKDLVARSRSKQLQPDEYSTGTFTVSNLGMFGVDTFDAILPPGTGSILAVGGSKPEVVVKDGLFGVRSQMTVNITCDHRIIYGADAAAFLQDLAKLIETETQSLTL
ncbi:MAG: dihydrolipoamide acetyltransferase family protein [Cyanobacteria bacterium P01_H01_bin.15]